MRGRVVLIYTTTTSIIIIYYPFVYQLVYTNNYPIV